LLEGIQATMNGGLILYGVEYTERDENPFAIERAGLVKFDSEGSVDWAREFPEAWQINAVLQLRNVS
jgi:hypothetical protein